MLKTKHLVMLAAVLVGLALISLLQRSQHERSTSRAASAVLIDAELSAGELSRVAVGYGDEPEAVVLARGPEGWLLPTAWDAAANQPRLEALLRALGGLRGEFRSDAADVLADYGLADSTALSIRVWNEAGEEVVALLVGGKPERHPGNFVRRPGDNAVYVSGTNLLNPLGLYNGPARPGNRHFLELEVALEEREDVDAITLWDEHGERRLVKEFAMTMPAEDDTTGAAPQPDRLTWEWRLESPRSAALAKTRADAVLGALCRLRAVDVDDPTAPPAAYGLDDPARRARLTLADGRELEFVFGAARAGEDDRPGGVWTRAGDGTTVWVVADSAVDGIFKTVEDLLPES